jgi:peptidoglycan/LPS O-acetylase OafA/YrhL
MLVFVVAWITLFDLPLVHQTKGDLIASLFYVSNWWFIFHKISYFDHIGTASPFNHLWSLAVEEQFYLLWPLLLTLGLRYLKQKTSILWLILLFAIISVLLMATIYQAGTDPSRVYYGTDTRVFSLLFGALLAMVWPSYKLSGAVPKYAMITLDVLGSLSLLTILLMILKTNQFGAFLYKGGMVLASIAAVCLVAALVHPASLLSKLLGFKPLRWIGVRSYAMYLWHYPVIVLTGSLLKNSDLFRMTLQVLLIILLSALSWHYIENPIRHGAIGKLLKNKSFFKQISLLRKLSFASFMIILGIGFWGVTSSASGNQYTEAKGLKSKIEENEKALKSDEHRTKTEKEQAVPVLAAEEDTSITAIGDSVLVMVAPDLQKEFPDIVIDAKVGRQMNDASAVIQRLKAEGKLGDTVIIELGTNGPIDQKQLDSLIASLGTQKKIIFVNVRVPRPWENEVNSVLGEAAVSSPRITLVNWYDESIGKESYFYSDGIHPNPEGSQAYASLIKKAIEN